MMKWLASGLGLARFVRADDGGESRGQLQRLQQEQREVGGFVGADAKDGAVVCEAVQGQFETFVDMADSRRRCGCDKFR